jgi:hypothetical protein
MEFEHKILGLFGAVSAGIRGIFGVEVERGCLQRFDEDRQAFLRLTGAQLFRYSFELLQFQLGEKEREAVEWGWN